MTCETDNAIIVSSVPSVYSCGRSYLTSSFLQTEHLINADQCKLTCSDDRHGFERNCFFFSQGQPKEGVLTTPSRSSLFSPNEDGRPTCIYTVITALLNPLTFSNPPSRLTLNKCIFCAHAARLLTCVNTFYPTRMTSRHTMRD